jgi:antitoxin component HigA of HigAB toxin-antitoxin module
MRTDYEILEQAGERFGLPAAEATEGKRMLRQEELIVDAQEEIARAMNRMAANRAQLAEGLGKSRAFVTQILSSGRNLTLRTWADIATALGHRVVPRMVEDGPGVTMGTTANSKERLVDIRGKYSTRFVAPRPESPRDLWVAS